MPRRRRELAMVVVCALAVAGPMLLPASARGGGWPLVSDGGVALRFSARYTAPDGTTAIHRGIDIEATAGSRVVAPSAGEVSFAGRVPGPQGGSVLAATLVTSGGAITLMPLASLGVEAGDKVGEGTELGTLAGTGDPSSPGAHLHVGAKSGDLYIDPLTLLTAPATSKPAGDPEVVPGTAEVPSGATVAAAPSLASAGTRPLAVRPGVTISAGASSFAAQSVPSRVARAAESGAPLVVSPGASLAPGVSVAGAPSALSATSLDTMATATRDLLFSSAASASGSREGIPAGPLLEHAMKLAVEAARMAGLGLAAVLLALGALWPIWRREKRKGPVQVSVRPSGDDVAAVAGR